MNRQECKDFALRLLLTRVSREVFFAAIGSRDVHPHLDRRAWNNETGYPTTWKHRDGSFAGYSYCGEGEPGAGGVDHYWIRSKLLRTL